MHLSNRAFENVEGYWQVKRDTLLELMKAVAKIFLERLTHLNRHIY